MQSLQWDYFFTDNLLQAKDELAPCLYWISVCGDIYTLNYSSDLFDLSFYDILDVSQDLDYLKDVANKHYKSIIEYID